MCGRVGVGWGGVGVVWCGVVWCGVVFFSAGFFWADARGKARDAGWGSSLPNCSSRVYSSCRGGMHGGHRAQTLSVRGRWPSIVPAAPFKAGLRCMWPNYGVSVRSLVPSRKR